MQVREKVEMEDASVMEEVEVVVVVARPRRRRRRIWRRGFSLTSSAQGGASAAELHEAGLLAAELKEAAGA